MCGLVAHCGWHNQAPWPIATAMKALRTLKHRGPDGSGHYCSEQVFLGHQRLAIRDLHHGKQPYVSPCGRFAGIINGEIYNHQQLKQQLQAKGITLSSNCDSELLLPLYQLYGEQMLKQMQGEFAFVIWDKHKQSIFAARDPFGVKPLYYTEQYGKIILASEVKAILAYGIPAVWNIETLVAANHSFCDPKQTCFHGIQSLLPGHYMIANQSGVTESCYWDMPFAAAHDMTEQEACEALQLQFTQAVKSRLTADVPVASYLSGGIDSTAVTAAANRLSHQPIPAYTIRFTNALFNEADLAKRSAAWLGCPYREVEVSDRLISESLEACLWHSESVLYNTHGVALYLLGQKIRQDGHRVVLSGSGSDELLYGYSFFKAEAQKTAPSASDHSPIGAGIVTLESDDISNQGQIALMTLYQQRGAKFNSWYHTDLSSSKGFLNNQSLRRLQQRSQALGLDPLQSCSYLFSHTTLPSYILSAIGDRMEMANSLEGRVPFLDIRLAKLIGKLPNTFKLRGAQEKFILRQALASRLPPEVINRAKQPFAAPPANKALQRQMQDIFHSRLLKESPIYCQKKVLHTLKQYNQYDLTSHIACDSRLLEVLSSCLLQKLFGMTEAKHHEEACA